MTARLFPSNGAIRRGTIARGVGEQEEGMRRGTAARAALTSALGGSRRGPGALSRLTATFALLTASAFERASPAAGSAGRGSGEAARHSGAR